MGNTDYLKIIEETQNQIPSGLFYFKNAPYDYSLTRQMLHTPIAYRYRAIWHTNESGEYIMAVTFWRKGP